MTKNDEILLSEKSIMGLYFWWTMSNEKRRQNCHANFPSDKMKNNRCNFQLLQSAPPKCPTPPKFNMEPKNEGLEDVFPFQMGDFQVSFLGCTHLFLLEIWWYIHLTCSSYFTNLLDIGYLVTKTLDVRLLMVGNESPQQVIFSQSRLDQVHSKRNHTVVSGSSESIQWKFSPNVFGEAINNNAFSKHQNRNPRIPTLPLLVCLYHQPVILEDFSLFFKLLI